MHNRFSPHNSYAVIRTHSLLLPLLVFGPLIGGTLGHAASQPNAWQIADGSINSGVLFYTNTLTAQQKIDATNQGWHFTVVSRLVAGSGNANPGQFMIYGLGDRRFIVGWDTNAAGHFTARLTLTNATTIFTNLTAPGEATNDYHRHELVYDPATRLASYLFDGASIYTWPGVTNDASFNGQAAWGAASNGGRGKMNYSYVQFAIGGQIVSEYFAGSVGNPAIAPSPTNQGWSLTWTAPSTTLTNFPVSPDAAIVVVPPVVVTQPATAIVTTNATLNATVTPGNFPTAYFFQYGLSTNYGGVTPVINLPPSDSAITVSNTLTGLSPGTLYHFRVVATNSLGATFGNDVTFTTAPASPVSFPVSPAYTWTTLAGYGAVGSADGPGGEAQFNLPAGNALDAGGNIYLADSGNHTIRKITPAGVVSTIAGLAGVSGSADGSNSLARFNTPRGIAVDEAANLYVTDSRNHTVRKLTPDGTNWVVSTIAGLAGMFGVNNGTGTNAQFRSPEGLTLDSATNLYLADYDNHAIRKVAPVGTNWVVSTLAGLAGISGTNNGVGTNAQFFRPRGVAVDSATNLFVVDTLNNTIRKITPVGTNWVVSTIAGSPGVFGQTDGTNGNALFIQPACIAVSGAGHLFVGDSRRVRKVTPVGPDWVVTPLAGNVNIYGNSDGTGTSATFLGVNGLAEDSVGNVVVSDGGNSLIRSITPAAVVSTLAGTGGQGSVNGTGDSARFFGPFGVAVDASGNVFVADLENSTIRKITSAGVVSTIAGLAGNNGANNGAGSLARFNKPQGVAVAADGSVYVGDTGNHTIRKIAPDGVVSMIAGLAGASGSADGTNSAARFYGPNGIAVDSATNLYVADVFNDTIRKITPVGTNWVVSTFVGLAGVSGTNNGTGTNALFHWPQCVALDSAGNLYVTDSLNLSIRKVTPAGVVSTIAGSPGNSGNTDGTGGNARFRSPQGIAMDSANNLYVADFSGHIIRKLVFFGTAWVVSTIGGSPDEPGSADGAGKIARFSDPGGITVGLNGDLYVGDYDNNTIRKGVFTPFAPINQIAYGNPAMNGRLTVTLTPTNAGGQWRFPWELGWHNSGVTVSNLVAGNYPVEFRSLPGYLILPIQPVQVTSGLTTAITNEYLPTLSAADTNSGPGSLTVFLGPTPPTGARWGFLGEGAPALTSGLTTNLLPGTYLIEFAAVSGRVKPSSQTVQVNAGQPSYLSVNYLLAAAPPANALLPFPVPANQVNDEATFPFGFNGQLQSDTGYGSGVAVQANVVLTAAHLVFNDQTLSYVRHAYWFFRRNAGVSEPLPQEARGFYVLSGYAAQRTNDLFSGSAPEQSTAPSRNLDVAALYFSEPVAGGGFGGYLPSDAVPNTWLGSAALKMLVGYPVDGSQFGMNLLAGKMYQTEPQPHALTRATDPVANQQVYLAPWFLSYPGNSGGPIYVQFNGYYYPAGVYLGTLFNGSVPYASVVRAIDSNVVNLITRAATQGDSGTNFTGGGVITIIPSQAVSLSNPGFVQFVLTPPSAVRAGAGWRLQGDSVYSNAPTYTRPVFSTNAFAMEFAPIPGWNLPSNQTVFVSPGVLITKTAFYSVTNPLLFNIRVGATNRIIMTGTTGTTYRLERTTALTNANWLTVSTNTIRTTNFNPVLTNPPPGFYRLLWLTNF